MSLILCFYENEYFEKVPKKNLVVIVGGGALAGVIYNLLEGGSIE